MNLRTQPDLELACDKQKINPTQHAINLEIQWLVVIPKKIKIKKLSLSHTHITLVLQMYTPLMSKYFLKKRHLKEACGFSDKGKKIKWISCFALLSKSFSSQRRGLSLSLSLSSTGSQNMFFFIPSTHVVSITFTFGGCCDHSRGLLVLISVQ